MIARFEKWVHKHVYYPGDSEETLMIKRIWWVCLTFANPTIFLITLVLFLMGQTGIGYWMLASVAFWLFSMLIFDRVKRGIEWFGLSSQLFLIIHAFCLTWLTGGILHSGGIFLFGLVGPVYALVFPDRKRAILVFLLYIASILLLLFAEPFLNPVYRLSYRQNLFLFVCSFLITALFWYAAIYFFADQRSRALAALRREEEKTSTLLLNILPAPIVQTLKDTAPEIIADQLEDVTILFADLVNFSSTVSSMPPERIVRMLNQIFTTFDQFTEKHQLEKIKTIGDCYMAVAGAPIPLANHAHAAVNMALEIQTYARENNLQFRVGINSGTVVAGVIGKKKFSYDLWGDSVNIASRLESNAPPEGILISDSTYRLITNQYHCQPAGERDLKGVGRIKTWEVTGRKTSSRASAPTGEKLL